jgi:DNA-directed RNA polymerase specialized sigma24 family protein
MIREIQVERQALDARIEEYRVVLAFIATPVLRGPKGAEEAVRNCLLAAAHASTGLLSRAELGSWLLRTVIDEALFIRGQELERAR